MNRQTKRMLQRQGQIGPDGTPLAPSPAERQERRPPTRTPVRAQGGPPRPGAFTRMADGVKDVRGELRKVAWGTPLEVRNYTTVVVVTLVILVSFVFALNLGFARAISGLVGT